jgi:hypothetical protein
VKDIKGFLEKLYELYGFFTLCEKPLCGISRKALGVLYVLMKNPYF